MKSRIVVSAHARERMLERIGCSEEKLMKIALKAFNSTEIVKNAEIPNKPYYERKGGQKYIYRKLMGRIFVFRTRGKDIILITVFPPNY